MLNPTRGDSFSLVTLEAIKYGCAVLATDIYAIKEMDINGYNGFITQSMIKVWDEDGKLNKYYRTHQNELLRSGLVDLNLVEWMHRKLTYLDDNREIAKKMCINSLNMSRKEGFSSQSILNKWKEIIDTAINS